MDLKGNQSAALLLLATAVVSCGERTSDADVERMSRALANVMISVQRGDDSTSRTRLADSVARAEGFEGWADLSDAIADVTVEPERLRTILDSAQKRIEVRAR